MKEYWNKAERLRKRINRKIHEIRLLRQRAEGMNGTVMHVTCLPSVTLNSSRGQ